MHLDLEHSCDFRLLTRHHHGPLKYNINQLEHSKNCVNQSELTCDLHLPFQKFFGWNWWSSMQQTIAFPDIGKNTDYFLKLEAKS